MISKELVVQHMVHAFQAREYSEEDRSLWMTYARRWHLKQDQKYGSTPDDMFKEISNKGESFGNFHLWEKAYKSAGVKDGEIVTIIGPEMGIELFQAVELFKNNKIIVLEPDKVACETLSEIAKYYTTSYNKLASESVDFHKLGIIDDETRKRYDMFPKDEYFPGVYEIRDSHDVKRVLGTEFTDVVFESSVYGAITSIKGERSLETLDQFISELVSYLKRGGRFVCSELRGEVDGGLKQMCTIRAFSQIAEKNCVEIQLKRVRTRDSNNVLHKGYLIIGRK